MSSIFEPRLKPLPSTFFSQDGDASPDRSPVLRRSASFSGYAPYKLLDDSDDGHSNEVSRVEPQDSIILWPDTDDESQIEQAECDAWTTATPKTCATKTENPEAREEKPHAQKTTEEAHFKIQVNLETALLPSRTGEDFDQRIDERSNFLPSASTLRTFPSMHRGYEEFAPTMSRPAEMEHERSDGQVLSLKLEVLNPNEARFKNWNRCPARRSKPLEREIDVPGTLPENTNPKQTVPQQVMQALKAGEAALQKARALMPAVNMKPRVSREDPSVSAVGKGRGRK